MQFSLELEYGIAPEPVGIESWRDLGVTASDLQQYKHAVEWWYKGKEADGDGKHDVGHITRVLVLAAVSAAHVSSQGISVNPEVVYWAIVLHDAKSNHHDVSDHGEEAADFFAPLLQKRFDQITARHIESIIRWHNKKIVAVPEEIQTPEFLIVTGADALDLVRMEDEREIVVPTVVAWELRRAAQVLYQRSMMKQTGDAFEDVLCAAEAIGLLAHCR